MQLSNSNLLRTQAYTDGLWTDAASAERISVTNPASGAVVAEVTRCGAADTRRAILAAERAQLDWRRLSAKERADVLRRIYEAMMAHQEDLARILTAEQGKPLAEARVEIAYGASYFEWFAEEARRIYGDTIPAPSTDKRIVTIKQPVGVVACITPWNFPNAMLARKIAPALAAGCSVVCKPATATPLSALAIAALADEAGVPPGVVNVVVGDTRAIGGELTGHPAVRKLTFTGSTAVGKALIRASADTVKRVSMELGGNAPFIVFDDANLETAVQGAIACKYRNAGQTCVSANRILVQSGIFDAFAERFTSAAQDLKLGDGMEAGTTMGPLIDASAAGGVRRMIDEAVSEGATLLAGPDHAMENENFVGPTVLAGVTPDMRICREEIFGPAAPLLRFDTEAEAIQLANGTPFGLAAYFYARDVGRIYRVGEGLEFGIVGVNEGIISNAAAPFGGVKESGYGREGSRYGLDDYLEIKYLCLGEIE